MNPDTSYEFNTIWDEAKDHIEQRQYDKAIDIYKYILVRYGDNPVAVEYANAYLGDLFLTLRKLDLAEDHIKKAISVEPENPSYRYILGFIYSIQRQWDEAIPEFEAALDKDPKNGEFFRGLGWAIYSGGDMAKGLNILEEARRLEPANAYILTDLAAAYLSGLQLHKARKCAERALHIDPANSLAKEILGGIRSFEKVPRNKSRAVMRRVNNNDIIGVYNFKVSLQDNPDVWRIIEIKGNQMLSSLHKVIFKTFNRFDEHQYSFFMSNKPFDKESEYMSPGLDIDGMGRLANRISIDSLTLHIGQKFLYIFDYGDEWRHEVELISIIDKVPRGNYPRVVKRHGKSPPQYPR